MEEYRIIKGFENYEISNLGNVRNLKSNRLLKSTVNSNGYFLIKIEKSGIRKAFKLHRLIAMTFIPNPNNKPIVDHIDGNKTNNQIDNLRWASKSENGMNRKLHSNNKSGFTGIYTGNNKFRAELKLNNKKYCLGTFNTLEEAIQARVNKSKELFGEFQSKQEKELVLNIKIPSNTKLTLNINIDEDYEKLEKEFELLINKN